MAAAVGSLMMSMTSSPASEPASWVAFRRGSLKKAGTVITTLRKSPSLRAASRRSLSRMNDWMTSGGRCSPCDRLAVDRAAHVALDELGHVFRGGDRRLDRLLADDHAWCRRRKRRWA